MAQLDVFLKKIHTKPLERTPSVTTFTIWGQEKPLCVVDTLYIALEFETLQVHLQSIYTKLHGDQTPVQNGIGLMQKLHHRRC